MALFIEKRSLIGILGFLLLSTLVPRFSDASDFYTPRMSALGGAGHAFPKFSDAVYLNPSYVSLIPAYALSLNSLGASAPNLTSSYFNFSMIAGARSLPVHFGLGYARREDGTLANITLSKSLSERLSLGFGAQFYSPFAATGASADFSISSTFVAPAGIQISLLIDHLTEQLASSGFTREITLGTKFSVGSRFAFLIDPHWNSSGFGIQVGTEVSFLEYLFVRLGGFTRSTAAFNNVAGDGWGTGLGLALPQFSFDYSYSRSASDTHSLGATVYF